MCDYAERINASISIIILPYVIKNLFIFQSSMIPPPLTEKFSPLLSQQGIFVKSLVVNKFSRLNRITALKRPPKNRRSVCSAQKRPKKPHFHPFFASSGLRNAENEAFLINFRKIQTFFGKVIDKCSCN